MDWLISTKLAPAVSNRLDLPRVDLLNRLGEVRDLRLALVNAPAGYGKTSLLNQLWAFLKKPRVKVAWLSLDNEDAEPAVFLAYVIAAIDRAGVDLGGLRNVAVDGLNGEAVRATVVALINRCALEKGHIVLILDDYQWISGSAAGKIVQTLLERMPKSMHLVIGTRGAPQLELAALRTASGLIEVSVADLSMNFDDARSLLTAGRSDAVSEGDVALLLQRTEGWPIALCMARSWLDRRSDKSALIKSFTGRVGDLAAYLAEQILLTLPVDLQMVLMRIALVDRISGDLLNTLCERWDGGLLLEQFEGKNLMLSRLDDEGHWYRLHPLFAEFLMERLKRRDAQLLPELLRRAAYWFERQDLLQEALRLAWSGDDDALAAELLERAGGWRLTIDGRIALLRGALARLTDEVVLRSPRLALGRAVLLAKTGAPVEARLWFERVRAATAGFSTPPDGGSDGRGACDLAVEADFVDLAMTLYADTYFTPQWLERVAGLKARLPSSDAFLHAICENSLCKGYFDGGDYARAQAAAERAIRYYRLAGSLYGEIFIYFIEGGSYLAQGRLRDAEAVFSEAHSLAIAHFGEECDLAAIADVHLAELLYERNQVKEAADRLTRSLAYVEQADASFDVLWSGYVTAAYIARLTEGTDAWRPVLDRARQEAARRGTARLDLMVQMRQVLELLRSGATAEAIKLSHALNLNDIVESKSTDPLRQSRRVRETGIRVLARCLLATGEKRPAIDLLNPLVEELTKLGRTRLLIEVLILRARAGFFLGNREQSAEDFDRAVSLAMFEGMRRIFIDESHEIAPVLDMAIRDAGGRGANSLKARFLSGLLESARKESRRLAKETRPHGLSEREREILAYLDRGYVNKIIAKKLQVSESTVKFHLRNLFVKLGVHTREQAVQLLRQDESLR